MGHPPVESRANVACRCNCAIAAEMRSYDGRSSSPSRSVKLEGRRYWRGGV